MKTHRTIVTINKPKGIIAGASACLLKYRGFFERSNECDLEYILGKPPKLIVQYRKSSGDLVGILPVAFIFVTRALHEALDNRRKARFYITLKNSELLSKYEDLR